MQEGEAKDRSADEHPAANWQFHANDTASSAQPATAKPVNIKPVNWTALEFVEHEKQSSWYAVLGGSGFALTAIVYLLTKDRISAFMVVFVTVIFGVLAARKPRQMAYAIDVAGIHIGQKLYGFEGFKSFSIVDEGVARSVWLLPLKRFMPIVPIYYQPADEEKIVNALAGNLPLENRQPDVIDKFMHRIHF